MRTLIFAAALLLAACASTEPPKDGPGALLAQMPAQPGAAGTAAAAEEDSIAGSRVALINPSFEAPKLANDEFEGWQTSQHAGVHSYDFDLDRNVKYHRKQSMRITSVGPELYGAVYQILPTDNLKGRTVELSMWVRTAQATGGGAQLTLIARTGGAVRAHKFLNDPGVTGTQDWKRYSIRLAIPRDTERLEAGAMLVGPGTVWLDLVQLTTVN
jgi:hypothetical protein